MRKLKLILTHHAWYDHMWDSKLTLQTWFLLINLSLHRIIHVSHPSNKLLPLSSSTISVFYKFVIIIIIISVLVALCNLSLSEVYYRRDIANLWKIPTVFTNFAVCRNFHSKYTHSHRRHASIRWKYLYTGRFIYLIPTWDYLVTWEIRRRFYIVWWCVFC